MKYIDLDDLKGLPGRVIKENDTFSFQCHSGLECFNRCCRNLNLFLYPYDIVRLKNRAGITSDIFLDKYVDIVLRPSSFFPEVLLSMKEDEEKTCPFLSESGCLVYSDRPDACRTFPVEQGVVFDAKTKKKSLISFFRPPDFCLGQYEDKQWTPAEWAIDQDALIYHKMTALWAGIKSLFQKNPWGAEGNKGQKAKMAFMAVYNIDQFREFLFKSTFFKRYKVKPAIKKKIKKNDVELMKFGFEWVNFFVWGIKNGMF